MQKILYINKWENDERKSWSGTPFSLYKTINNKCDVQRVDIKYTPGQKIFQFIGKSALKLFGQSDFDIFDLTFGKQQIANSGVLSPNNPIIMFSSYDGTWAEDSYIYIVSAD